MTEITILTEFPIILTKEGLWRSESPAKAGSIIVLPEDAVLVALPINEVAK